MEKQLQALLAFFAKRIIAKYNPFVIAVTGSVGKTSAKEAIYAAVEGRQPTRTAQKNYNNELGVPLTVIGGTASGKDLLGWLRVFGKATGLLLRHDAAYPKCLVLEYAADHPGDIEYLMRLVPPSVGVLTAVAPSHTEFFGSVEAIAEEKGKIVRMLPSHGIGIINADDPWVVSAARKTPGHVRMHSYGVTGDAEAVLRDATTIIHWDAVRSGRGDVGGVEAEVWMHGKSVHLMLQGVAGKHSVYAALAGLSVASALGYDLDESVQAIEEKYHAPKGRMRLLRGIKHTVLMDDTYNASPKAAIAALEALAESAPDEDTGGRRIAVLGDMAELGALTESSHREVGEKAAMLGIDILICVGEKSRDTARGAKDAGMPEEFVFNFPSPKEAGLFVQERMHAGDVVLIKGSQSSRMEKVTKEIMGEPQRAAELLVRQEEAWTEKE